MGRWQRIAILVVSIGIGVTLLGQVPDKDSQIDEIMGGIGLAVLVGGWMIATRGSGLAHSAGQQHNEAELRRILEMDADYRTPDLKARAGTIYMLQGNLRKAIEWLEPAVAAAPTERRYRYTLGQAYLFNSEPKKAWPEFEAVYQADSDYDFGEIRLWVGRCYLALQEPANALQLADQFIQKHGTRVDALVLRADAQAQAGRPGDAAATYREVLEQLRYAPAFHRDRHRELIAQVEKRLARAEAEQGPHAS